MTKRQATHLAKLYFKALSKRILDNGSQHFTLSLHGFCPAEVEIYMELNDLAHWTHDNTEGITNEEALREINHGLEN
tara:strand:+ start:101 stop:331 length:231 start_codon:yes stop_codon:yes gene_type:complete